MNLRFYLFVSGVNQGNELWRSVQDFLVLSQGCWSLPSIFTQTRWRHLVGVDDQANSGWFLFYWRFMVLWVMIVGFENTCTVSDK